MKSNIELDRRTVLGTVGGLAVAGSGLAALTGGATASAGSDIDNPQAVKSDDGEITYVATQTTGRLTWDGFDTPAKQGRIMVYVTLQRDGNALWGENLIHDTGMFDLDSSWGGPGEDIGLEGDHEAGQEGYIASDADWGICQKDRQHYYDPSEDDNIAEDGNGYGLPENPAPVSHFTAGADGSSQKTGVVMRSVYMLFDKNGNELTGQDGYPDRPEAESHFIVTVNNEEATTGFGDSDGEGDTEDSASVGV